MSAPLILTNPADFGIVRKNEILGYCDIYKYVWRGETVRSRQGKRKLQDSMEPMLPQSLGASDSEILGVRDCHGEFLGDECRPHSSPRNSPWQSLTPWISESDAPKDFGNIASILSLSFRFPWRLPSLSPRHPQTNPEQFCTWKEYNIGCDQSNSKLSLLQDFNCPYFIENLIFSSICLVIYSPYLEIFTTHLCVVWYFMY